MRSTECLQQLVLANYNVEFLKEWVSQKETKLIKNKLGVGALCTEACISLAELNSKLLSINALITAQLSSGLNPLSLHQSKIMHILHTHTKLSKKKTKKKNQISNEIVSLP